MDEERTDRGASYARLVNLPVHAMGDQMIFMDPQHLLNRVLGSFSTEDHLFHFRIREIPARADLVADGALIRAVIWHSLWSNFT
jgi:hypothetical protein